MIQNLQREAESQFDEKFHVLEGTLNEVFSVSLDNELKSFLSSWIERSFEAGEQAGREKAVEYINIRAVRGQGHADGICVYEENLQEVLEAARAPQDLPTNTD